MSYLRKLYIATRPYSFPLSLIGVVVGNAIAWADLIRQGRDIDGVFWLIMGLTLLTAVILQILSNLANDYGDGQRGTDAHRTDRNFTLSPQELIHAIIGFVVLACISGLSLLGISLGFGRAFVLFLGIGVCAIIAAITYTMGKNPYGYQAKGEIAVFVFFGMVNVLGAHYLQSQQLSLTALTFAIVIGILCTCVLTVNNLRDMDGDRQAGKTTLAIILGKQKMSSYYQRTLVFAFLLLSIYALLTVNYYFIAILLLIPVLYRHILNLNHYTEDLITSEKYGEQLQIIVQITLITGLISSIALILK